MKRVEAITRLQECAPAIKARGAIIVVPLWLRGARDEAAADSDLDLFIDYDPASRFNAFDLVGIKLFLEDELKTAVDLTTRDGLHPRLRHAIEKSAVRLPRKFVACGEIWRSATSSGVENAAKSKMD